MTEFWTGARCSGVGFLFLAEPDPWPQDVRLCVRDGMNVFLRHGWFRREDLQALGMPAVEIGLRQWPPDIADPLIVRVEFDGTPAAPAAAL